ncbi:MAG: hypothetical protein WD535_01265 [Thermaerobacterales bacterium]
MKTVMMQRGARTVIHTCGKVQPGEQVIIITDGEEMTRIAAALAGEAYALGAHPAIINMLPRQSDGQEPPRAVAVAMRASDIFFSVVTTSITHSQAVIDAIGAGSRGIMMSQFTEDMLVSGGIEADFAAVAPVCRALSEAMADSELIRLTNPFGTDLTMSSRGRKGNAMTCMVDAGQFSAIPNVEANVAVLEGTAEGVIAVDASIPYAGIGLVQEPVMVGVRKGMIVSIEGGADADRLRTDLESMNDPMVYNIAELGIGVNPQCRFIGAMLEDEGVWGAVHIGIGTNETVGGTVRAACHYDLILTQCTLLADGREIIKDGDICI